MGSAAFSISGKGSFKILSNSEMVFPPDPRYSAELKAGSVVMNSFNGATDISLRVGNYVVAPVIEAQQSTSQVVRHADGSFTDYVPGRQRGDDSAGRRYGARFAIGESINILPSGELDIAKVIGGGAGDSAETNAHARKPSQILPSRLPRRNRRPRLRYRRCNIRIRPRNIF